MQIKHTWTEQIQKGIFSEKFKYQLEMRGALTQDEQDAINKYKVMNAWVYSNRDERERQKNKPSWDDDWLAHAAAGWHNAGIEPLLEISISDLLRGVVIKNENPYYLDAVFTEVSKNCENLLSNLFDLNRLFSGEEKVTEVFSSPNQQS